MAQATLTLGPDAGSLYDLGWAKKVTGQPGEAMDAYEQALTLYRQAGDRWSEAATLASMGWVYTRVGSAWAGVGVLRAGPAHLAGGR